MALEAETQLVRESRPSDQHLPCNPICQSQPNAASGHNNKRIHYKATRPTIETMQTTQIAVLSTILGFGFLFVMAIATRVFWHKYSKPTTDEMHLVEGDYEHHHQLSKISTLLKRTFVPKQDRAKGRWVPTLSAMIKAGDEGVFSSALFANPHGYPGEIPIQEIYDAFAEELRSRPLTERTAYAGKLSRFLSSTKRATIGPKRTQSLSHRATGRSDGQNKSQRKSLDISGVERGFARSSSVKKPAPILIAMGNGFSALVKEGAPPMSWMNEGRIAESRYGSTSVAISPAELVTLSIVLASPLSIDEKSDLAHFEKGAFDLSICQSVTEDGKYQISLRQHKRSISHMSTRGSGFSTLFAKHIATGCLPYSQDNTFVQSILVTNQTLRAVQAGSPIYLHKPNVKSRPLRLLASLPSSREINFQAAGVSTEPLSENPLIDAIGTLPFLRGLVPLASRPLIDTIQHVAFGGRSPGRLLQRLEGLIDKINRHAPHLSIFGPLYEPQNAALLYRTRDRLGRLATCANATESIADKTARIQRYITLLERLMALIPGMKHQDVMTAVQNATKNQLYRSYADACTGHEAASSSESLISDSHTADFIHRHSHRSSDASTMAVALPRSSAGSPRPNLGKQVELILKADLPLSVEAVAVVARMVIAAWTLSVEVVAWEEGEQGFRIPDLGDLPDKMVMC
jgi:hypothetical protein